jgi:hypothetical protein
MDLEYHTFQHLCLSGDGMLLVSASARIREWGSGGYRVVLDYGRENHEAFVVPTLADARAAVEERAAEAAAELAWAREQVLQNILQHPWWQTALDAEEVDRIIELASVHPDGMVLIDPRGGYTWAPAGSWHTGRHLRLEVPPGGQCSTAALFALLRALDRAVEFACPPPAALAARGK